MKIVDGVKKRPGNHKRMLEERHRDAEKWRAFHALVVNCRSYQYGPARQDEERIRLFLLDTYGPIHDLIEQEVVLGEVGPSTWAFRFWKSLPKHEWSEFIDLVRGRAWMKKMREDAS